MTAWGVVAVSAAGGAVAGPFLDMVARRVRRAAPAEAGADAGVTTPALLPQAIGDAPAPVTVPTPGTGPALGADAAFGPAAGFAAGEAVVVAVVTAGLFALAAVRLGAVPQLGAYCALFAGLVAVSVTDLRTGLVPRRFVYAALLLVAVGLLAASADEGRWRPMLDAVIGGAAAFAVLGAVWWIYPKGMGFGDVRLAGLCGAALGWLGFAPLYLGFLASFVGGALAGVVVLAVAGRRRFPFAPALAAGTVFGVLWGPWLGHLWLHPG